MEIIFILLGISLIVGLIFLFSFLFSVKSGQYDDMYTPSVRILFENEKPLKAAEEEVEENKEIELPIKLTSSLKNS